MGSRRRLPRGGSAKLLDTKKNQLRTQCDVGGTGLDCRSDHFCDKPLCKQPVLLNGLLAHVGENKLHAAGRNRFREFKTRHELEHAVTAPLVRGLWLQLSPAAWQQDGMSRTNHTICILILISAAIAILETETSLVDRAAWLFEISAVVFPALFAIEYGARVYAAGAEARHAGIRGRLRYMATPCALLDLAAIAPSFLVSGPNSALLLRLFRLVRLIRLARFGRFSIALRALMEALERRCFELGLSMALAVMILIASGTLMYLVEGTDQPDAFGSIPRALWWSVATLTTVGYGDVYPITAIGRLVAGVTAIVAIGLVAMPAGILAAAFTDAFQRHQSDQRS